MSTLITIFASLTFIISAFGQLQRIEFMDHKANLYVYEAMMSFTLCVMMGFYRTRPFWSVRLYEFVTASKYFLLYMAVVLVGSFFYFSQSANSVALLYFLRLLAYFLFIVYFFYHCLQIKHNKAGRWSLIVFVVILITSAFAQFCYYPDLRNLMYAGWDPHYYRLFGLYFEPVIAAAVYGLVFFFLITNRTWKVFIRIPVALLFLGFLVATYSRGAWVAFFISILFYLARYKYIKLAVIGICTIGLLYIALPKPSGEGVNIFRTSTISSRMVDYSEGVTLWGKSPVFGIGYNHIQAVKHTPQGDSGVPNHAEGSLHASYLIILVTGGVIGILFYLNWLLQLSMASSFLTYSVVFIGVASLFDNVLLHPLVMIALAILGGFSLIRPSRT